MKCALVIGVSEYSLYNELPACKNDADALESLLLATGEFDDVRVLSDHTSNSDIKNFLASFVSEYQGRCPDQLLFYYSGHGHFDGNYF